MRYNPTIFLLISFLLLLSCSKTQDNDLEAKKALLKEKKAALEKLNSEVNELEKEIAQLDPDFQSVGKLTLVSVLTVGKSNFTHFVEVRGNVETDNNVILTAESMGLVKGIFVTEGQNVGQGQVLLRQENSVIQNSIEEVKSSLSLAEMVFQKQENLWNQKIGTEIQYLQAKNNKENIEKRLQTLYSQLELANVRAPFSGVVDEIFIKIGQSAGPGVQLMRLVSLNNIQVVADVSEVYLGKITRGDSVLIEFPSLGIEKTARILNIGQVINPDNRTFRIEAAVPNENNLLKPDLLATVKFKNYEKPNAVSIPTKYIQNDKAGDFVFVAEMKDKDLIAKKIRIVRGETYKEMTLIKEGLKGTEKLIIDGFREVAEGSKLKIAQ